MGVLVVLELMWVRVSLVMLALFFDTGLPTSAGLIEAAVNVDNLDFVAAYAASTSIFALLVFTLLAVSIPMLLDRGTAAGTRQLALLQGLGALALMPVSNPTMA